MKLPFVKMTGAGNDFILIKKGGLRAGDSLRRLAILLCDRRRGVGADGLLVLGSDSGMAKLLYFNSDGSTAFCGNGSRCAAWWLFVQGRTGGRRKFEFLTSAGPLRARIVGPGRVAIAMPRPGEARLGLKLRALDRAWTIHAIHAGVPHAVVEVNDVENLDVERAGKALRNHRMFKPHGANINFAAFGASRLILRTYERGVEAETLACGTGAVATALVGFLLGRCRPPVRIKVRSGETLKASFLREGETFKEVWLEGPAQVVCKGEIIIP